MRKLLIMLVLVGLLIGFAIPANADMQDMWAKVYSWKGDAGGNGKMILTEVSTGITFKVLRRNSDNSETLYYYNDDTQTSLSNPVSTTNFASATAMKAAGTLSFRVDPSEAMDRYVDLIVVNTAGGYTAFVEDFDQYEHSIFLDERPNIVHTGCIWFEDTTGDTEVDTGIDFEWDTLVKDVRIEVTETCAACTLDVGLLSSGTSGDKDGLIDNVVMSTKEYVSDTGLITNGTTIDYVPVSTYGALLYKTITGSDAVASNGGRSYLGYTIRSARERSLTYTRKSSGQGEGYIYYEFIRIR